MIPLVRGVTVAIGDAPLAGIPECVHVQTGEDVLETSVGHASPFINNSQILRALASELTPAMDRSQLNGIKVFLCRTPDSTTAEIRVNGEPAVLASEAMAAHPWPDVIAPAMARFYAVIVHPS